MSPVDVAYSETGAADAPVVVLASSLGTDRTMWDAVAAALSNRFRVVTYDHRGHGASPVPRGPYALDDLGEDAVRLLDRLGVERAHVAGLSLGGMVGMWLGIHRPERIGRLVVMCTSARLGPPTMWEDRARAVSARGTRAIAAAVASRWVTDAYRTAHPDVVAHLEALISAQPDEGYAACCHVVKHMDLRPDLPRITAPTLVLGAVEDAATPPEHQKSIAASIPGARLELLSPAAHLATVEQPIAIAKLTEAFLRA